METRTVQLRTHQKNIDRYAGLLETNLSEVERQYIEKRMSEERLAMALLTRIYFNAVFGALGGLLGWMLFSVFGSKLTGGTGSMNLELLRTAP